MKIKSINEFLKILLIVFCVLFIFTAIASTIISSDIFHTQNCCKDNCVLCEMIHSATQFSKNINYIMKYIVLLNATIPLTCIIKTKIDERLKETLVSFNVVLNE